MKLAEYIGSQENPSLVSLEVSFYLHDQLAENKINLYEAYLLNSEVCRLELLSFLQPAWHRSPGISACNKFLMQYYLSVAFDDHTIMKLAKDNAQRCRKLCSERRKHYILDRYEDFIDFSNHHNLLHVLAEYRSKGEALSFDNGPYHFEEFPHDYINLESILLNGESLSKSSTAEEVETILVALAFKG